MASQVDPGLCRTCRHVQRVASKRGGGFWLCGRHRVDPRYPKYPRLPVMVCAGFTAVVARGEGEAPSDPSG